MVDSGRVSDSTADGGGFALRWGDRAIPVPARGLEIGRSPRCTFILNDPLVSRRHVRIESGADGVLVTDLGSVNGVYVDGDRIGPEPATALPGSTIRIGGAELVVERADIADRSTMPGALPAENDEYAEADQEPDTQPEMHQSSTRRADALSMFADVARKSIEDGRAADAERLLERHLEVILEAARSGGLANRSQLDDALSFALEFAIALRSDRWLSYAIELLYLRREPPPDARSAELLTRAVAKVDEVDFFAFRRYVELLRLRAPVLGPEELLRVNAVEAAWQRVSDRKA